MQGRVAGLMTIAVILDVSTQTTVLSDMEEVEGCSTLKRRVVQRDAHSWRLLAVSARIQESSADDQ